MKHTSVKLNTPAEFINITGINPLVSVRLKFAMWANSLIVMDQLLRRM